MSQWQDKNKAELTEAIMRLETIVNNVGVYVYAKDMQGQYTYVNENVQTLFNCTMDDIIGKDDSHFFDLSLSQSIKENDKQVLIEGKHIENEEVNFIKETQEKRIYRSIKTPLRNAQNEIIGMCGISKDITEEKELQEKLDNHQKLLDVILNNVDAYIYMKDSDRHFRYVNSKVADLFGLPADKIIDQLDSHVIPQATADHFWESDKLVFSTQEKQTIEESIVDEHGKTHRYLSVKMPYMLDNKASAIIGFSTDVTELYELKEEFKKQANTDALTGLFNRRYFVEQAEKEFRRAKRYHLNLTLLSIDIDHFKVINDKFGHPVGDQVLVQVAQNLMPNLRGEDILARIGGEEFSILLPEITSQQAKVVAERIRRQQETHLVEGDWVKPPAVEVSIGVASLNDSDESFDELFSRADKALYIAKNSGRNQVCLFD